jgi:uncharacterized membrane protein
MVVKTMVEQNFCQDCNQKHDCQKVYQQLGDIKGPSVVIKVLVAFLLPLVVFIVSLAVFARHQFFVKNWCRTEELQTVLSFLMALLVTFVCVLIVRVVNRRISGLEN